MATIKNFEELKIWQKAKTVCKIIYHLTSESKFSKDFALKDQINRSSGSIMDNIAEGFGRNGNMEFINFLTYANGSAYECKSQLHRAFDRNYITLETQNELFQTIDEITKMLGPLISYLNSCEIRGIKFKGRK